MHINCVSSLNYIRFLFLALNINLFICLLTEKLNIVFLFFIKFFNYGKHYFKTHVNYECI